jgi:signal transduction histidine kinase
LLLPLLPTIVLARYTNGTSQTVAMYLAVAVMLIPLPVGLAISRYNLFNLDLDIRKWIARVVYFGTGALLITVVFSAGSVAIGQPQLAPDPTVVFSLSFACVAVLDPLRRRLLGLLEILLSARVDRLGKLRDQYAERMAELQDEEHVGRILASALREATGARSGCVFLRAGSEWRPVSGFGRSAPTSLALAEAARSLTRGSSILHLAADPLPQGDAAERLRAAGVELVALLRHGQEPVGVVLLASSKTRDPYTRLELDFVAAAVQHATMALHNARLAESLLTAERHATTGRIALGLAHDVGKDLDWLRKLARRLPERLEDRPRLVRDLGTVQELTEDLARSIRAFIHGVNQPKHQRSEVLELNHLIDRAVQTIARVHGDALVVSTLDPGARNLGVHGNFERALVNLLDNAVLASEGADPIRLFATLDRGSLRVVITDRGCGMEKSVVQRAFEAGFTTRSDQGGSGVGLAVCREIVESLGGCIHLSSSLTSGTVVTVILPIHGERSSEAGG